MELRFSSENEALQYLADISGKKIKVAYDKYTSDDSWYDEGQEIGDFIYGETNSLDYKKILDIVKGGNKSLMKAILSQYKKIKKTAPKILERAYEVAEIQYLFDNFDYNNDYSFTEMVKYLDYHPNDDTIFNRIFEKKEGLLKFMNNINKYRFGSLKEIDEHLLKVIKKWQDPKIAFEYLMMYYSLNQGMDSVYLDQKKKEIIIPILEKDPEIAKRVEESGMLEVEYKDGKLLFWRDEEKAE
jgi:hypothetical protein